MAAFKVGADTPQTAGVPVVAEAIRNGAAPSTFMLCVHRFQMVSPQALSWLKKGSVWTTYALGSPEGVGLESVRLPVPLISSRRNSMYSRLVVW